MQMESERRNNGGFVNYFDGGHSSVLMEPFSKQLPPLPSPPLSSSSSSSSIGSSNGVGGGGGGGSCIVHQVSKFDTLAGVAIKYGVEVADIKRMNGLVTDLQMFALKSLNIPLPGRHPPSPILPNGLESQGPSCEQTPPNRRHSDLYDSLQSLKLKPSHPRKVSSAMTTLQGYYGLKTPEKKKPMADGFEMALYSKRSSNEDDEHSPITSPPLSHHRKCRSIGNGLSENGDLHKSLLGTEAEETESGRWFDKLRRRQKSESDFSARTPEKLIKEESSGSCGFSASAGKGLALRPKAAAVINRGGSGSGPEFDSGFPNLGDYVVSDDSGGVRKSSSTSSLQDTDNGSGPSIWPTSKWSLKPDLQALSTAAITRPIFDGLPKPITGRWNKTAVD